MFSGIIQSLGRVTRVKTERGGKTVTIAPGIRRAFKKGDSVIVSGVCSTVVNTKGGLTFFYMPETLKKTTASAWRVGDTVNIEPSMRLSDIMSGHLVYGHVDGTARIEKIQKLGDSRLIWFRAPKGMGRYLVPKGSVALDGTSLTVVDAKGDRFSVSFIPYTLEHTTMGKNKIGHEVNFEADMLAKYLDRLMSTTRGRSGSRR